MTELFSDAVPVNTVSHLIQLSVAPVFLLAGIGSLLGVLVSRLSRIVSKSEELSNILLMEKSQSPVDRRSSEIRQRLDFLERRRRYLNHAILACTMTGLLVALVIMIMFLSAFFAFNGSVLIAVLFILAMASLIVGLLIFLREIYYASHPR
ncbi:MULTISPECIES: DUF2721 domain-containing protein [Piscirickettsiaceae]|jgi:uncharacterized membrane protein YkgB|uniref:DUF2721 domain-containing protein n=1 Tax=Hydrogenovibrio thermophilus TaxID=265883 RepID=A0A410H436_9GAMM|nr:MULTISPECIES: DUF2721 domain-containing protein [Piscirickettsiaceae]AZR81813.1 hypothetical protein AYJ59_05660 [Thiomicrospira sp. S5]QAB15657.1 DUF2721 domain-containing protein [Hydrogenovibrio thermophilus]